MSDDNKCGSVRFDLLEEQLQNVLFVSWVEVAGWFIGQEERWRMNQSAGDGDSLLFALRELAGKAVQLVGETESIGECFQVLGFGTGPGKRLIDQERKPDVFPHSEVREQLKLLKNLPNSGNAEVSSLSVTKPTDIGIVDAKAARVRQCDARDQIEQRGLAAAAGADESDLFTALDLQRVDLQRKRAEWVVKGEPIDRDHERVISFFDRCAAT